MSLHGERLPVLLVAGSFGAGKTTLLARWIGEPAFYDAAVIVNEPGETAVDAHLVGGFRGAVRSVAGGCACCAARPALVSALDAVARTRRGAPRFGRALVELGAAASLAPVLSELAGALRERFALQGVATVVDAGAGVRALDAPAELARIAAADVLVVSKTELVEAASADRLVERLAQINPDAEILSGSAGVDGAWEAAARAPGRERRHVESALSLSRTVEAAALERTAAHEAEAQVTTLRMPYAVELSGFCVRLASFLDAHEGRVLRVKGLVAVEGRGGPAIIQAVGSALQPVRTLKEWPAEGRESALVVVGRDLDAAALARLAGSRRVSRST